MINTGARIYFTIAGLALVGAIVYNIAADDRVGTTLLIFLMILSALTGVAVAGAGITDRALYVTEGSAISDVPVGIANTPRPSSWPLVAAVAVGLMAVGMAVGVGLVAGGFVATLLAAGGWLGQAWRESAGWNTARARRLEERLVGPFGI